MYLSECADDEWDDEAGAAARERVADAEDGPGEVGRQVEVGGEVAGGQGAIEEKPWNGHAVQSFLFETLI